MGGLGILNNEQRTTCSDQYSIRGARCSLFAARCTLPVEPPRKGLWVGGPSACPPVRLSV